MAARVIRPIALEHAWIQGVATALAEVHRNQGQSSTVCQVARDAGITIAVCKRAKVMPFDYRELKKAGVPNGR